MVILTITAKTPTGEAALVKVRSMKMRGMAKAITVSASVVKIIYAEKANAVIGADAMLHSFAVSRGRQMADETMKLHGATKEDYDVEVKV